MSVDEPATAVSGGAAGHSNALARFNGRVEELMRNFDPVYAVIEDSLARCDAFERTNGRSPELTRARREILRFRRVLRDELERLRAFLQDLPVLYLAELVKALDGPIDDSRLADARAQVQALPEEQRYDMREVARVTSTGDVVGALARGHSLVESALECCIVAALRNPPRSLRAELGLDCLQKIKLGRMVGVVTVLEARLLTHLTNVRNAAVHPRQSGRVRNPYGPDEERTLWGIFLAAEPFADGGWQPHDPAAFPTATTNCIVALTLVLGRRAELVASADAGHFDAAVSSDRDGCLAMPHLIRLVLTAAALLESDAAIRSAS
jgi:hypothetical protein